MALVSVNIGDLHLNLPIIQGGMGVGISLDSLASAVAREGGMGTISAAQPGFQEPDWKKSPLLANLRALGRQIRSAKEASRGYGGAIAVNIMRACTDYEKYVRTAVENGADAIISGAGLPTELPSLLADSTVKFAPIVSSLKAIRVLFTLWKRHGQRLSDFVVIEGPKAGGHLGFTAEEALSLTREAYDAEIRKILDFVSREGEAIGRKIPVFVAGGIFDRADIEHYLSLGADGVQMATRFVATKECDAPESFKTAYVNARKEDVVIVKSPVGMPGRAIRNRFVREREQGSEKVSRCFHCLEACNPAATPYCITAALCRAAEKDSKKSPSDTENALLFCGENVWKIQGISTVHEIISELNS